MGPAPVVGRVSLRSRTLRARAQVQDLNRLGNKKHIKMSQIIFFACNAHVGIFTLFSLSL
jgi:hypothetical protein